MNGGHNMNIDSIMKELAEYIRMQEEAAAMVESLKDQLKERMTAAGVESLAGSEHKATYKAVTSSRVDTTRLKKDLPEIAARYTKTTTARRFTFA
jgi:predicted phage-related endonuclease